MGCGMCQITKLYNKFCRHHGFVYVLCAASHFIIIIIFNTTRIEQNPPPAPPAWHQQNRTATATAGTSFQQYRQTQNPFFTLFRSISFYIIVTYLSYYTGVISDYIIMFIYKCYYKPDGNGIKVVSSCCWFVPNFPKDENFSMLIFMYHAELSYFHPCSFSFHVSLE